MDLEDIRRKRVKLFEGPRNITEQASTSSTTKQPDMDEDEKFARELQAAFERGEDLPSLANDAITAPPSTSAPNITGDEKFAHQLQTMFESGEDVLTFDNNASTAIPAVDASNVEDDEKLARELQAEFDNDNYFDYTPSPSPPSPQQPPRRKSKTSPAATTTTPIMATEPDESSDAVAVRDLANTIVLVRCSTCRFVPKLQQETVIELFNKIYHDTNGVSVNFLMDCAKCHDMVCFGCGTAVTVAGISYGNTAANGTHMTWHCDRGRMALIW